MANAEAAHGRIKRRGCARLLFSIPGLFFRQTRAHLWPPMNVIMSCAKDETSPIIPSSCLGIFVA